jgi:hypothetical protein
MEHSGQDTDPGRAFGGAYLWPRRLRPLRFWLGGLIALFLVGIGLAGLALGHASAGVVLFFGVVFLIAGARNSFHHRHGVPPGGTSHD